MTNSTRVLAVSAALMAAGCGGSGDDEALSKQEYVKQADAICADANKKEAALHPGEIGWYLGPQFRDADFLSRFKAPGHAALRELRRLTPSEEDRAGAGEVLSAVQRTLAAMDHQVAAIRSGHRERTSANTKAYDSAYSDLAASAGRFGLSECQGVGF